MKFKNRMNMEKVPYAAYSDSECIIAPIAITPCPLAAHLKDRCCVCTFDGGFLPSPIMVFLALTEHSCIQAEHPCDLSCECTTANVFIIPCKFST